MAVQLSTEARNAQCDAITTTVGNAGKLRIYTGSVPANVAAATTGSLLVDHTLGSPFAPAASGGLLSPTLPATVSASASGTAGYWRVFKSDGTSCVLQGTCGTSGTDMILDSTTLVSGVPVVVTAWSHNPGGA